MVIALWTYALIRQNPSRWSDLQIQPNLNHISNGKLFTDIGTRFQNGKSKIHILGPPYL